MSSPLIHSLQQVPTVTLERVSLRYGQGEEILKDINLSLSRGSFSFLTGVSGAGKSSLLKILSLSMPPTKGLVSLFGDRTEMIDRPTRQLMKRRIGLVSQNFNLVNHLNVFENVALALKVGTKPPENYAQDVVELLRWVGLGDRISHSPQTLSGGEKQRVAIARAVIAKPDLLLADEPTGNVDPAMAKRLLRLFLEMNRTGTTVLIATHDINLTREIDASNFHLEQGELHPR